jgi:RecB family exonuclease
MSLIQVSNSKLNTYRRCPNRYRYRYVLHLKRKERKLQLERGSWIHELLMVDADGEDWRVRHKLLTKKFYNLWEEEREDLGDLPDECARIMRSYKRYYKGDEQRYRVIDTEMDEIVTLPNGVELRIIVDKIVEDIIDGGLWAVDYKTRKSFTDPESMMIDPQLTLYFGSLEALGYRNMRGAMYDEIRTKAPTIPKILKSGGLSKEKRIDTDLFTYYSEIRRLDLDPASYSDILQHIARNQRDRFFRRTPIPKDPPVVRTVLREAMQTATEILSAEKNKRFPRSFENDCKYSCDYKDLCITELYGGNIRPIIKMNFTRRTQKAKDA